MTRKRIPCTLSSRVSGPACHSGSLGRVRTLGKIRPMAFFFVHGKCQHYYESGHPSSPSSDRRCPLPFAWTHQHDGTPVSAKATSYRLGGRGHPPPFFSRSAPALASWTLTFPCSGKGDAPQARVTRLGGGSVCGMQKS